MMPVRPNAYLMILLETPEKQFHPEVNLDSVFSTYWMWDLYPKEKKEKETKEEVKEVKTCPIEAKPGKKKWIEGYDFTDKILLLRSIMNGLKDSNGLLSDRIIVRSKRKSKSATGRQQSMRRSRFVGVSRNGTSNQVLIAVEGRKTYLGSFEDETEAAVTFDFYSILLHSVEANTNYSYSARQINEMLNNYELFNKSFNAGYYLNSNPVDT